MELQARFAETEHFDLAQYKQSWYIRDLQQVWHTALPRWTVIDRAENLMNCFSLSHWDSMIVTTCLEANVQRLYTEDFGY